MNLKQTSYIILALGLITQSCIKNNDEDKIKLSNKINDSIDIWIQSSKNKSYSINKRKQLLKKLYTNVKSTKIDTFQLRNLSFIAYQNLKLDDTLLFKKQNKETLFFAIELKDTFGIGDAHWNYASYYNKKQIYDSAYYHFNLAHNHFEKNNYLFESAKTQYGMAFIKGRFKDYSGSEVLTFKAIEKFKKIKNYKSLYSCYNHLGLLQNDIQEYDKALFYYNKALSFLNRVKENRNLEDECLNNIGLTYLEKGDYSKALKSFDKILANDSLKLQNIDHYSRVLDNKAYCRLLIKDTVSVVKHLKQALNIRDSLNNKGGVVISKIHLAHYYAYKQDTISAISYIKEAYAISKEIKNSRDYLESLYLLAKLDTKYTSKYLEKYIKFNETLQIINRKNQNKYTRIAYETNEYIEETERLSKQKIWILFSGFSVISILGFFYFLKNQKSKTERLRLENEQQKSNEQVYLITLKQQEELEKEKINERNRIAKELHDGILGKLFGTRVGLGFLEIKGEENIIKQHQVFLEELQAIEKEIREVSHRLCDNIDNSQISFQKIIYNLMQSRCKIGAFRYELNFDQHINWQNTNEIIKVNLYRIIQEALQNVIKYASAKNIIISFQDNERTLLMIIKDDGLGFDVKKSKKGIGIKNMETRVEKLNGAFNIYSKSNEGTTIIIKIPT